MSAHPEWFNFAFALIGDLAQQTKDKATSDILLLTCTRCSAALIGNVVVH